MDASRSILVVDDHPLICKALVRLLADALPGHSIYFDESAEAAFSRAHRLRDLELVVLDYCLPGLSGIEAARLFRKFYPQTKIVVCSGVDDRLAERAAMTAGASAFISKSRSLSDFKEIVARVLMGSAVVDCLPATAADSSARPVGVGDSLTARQRQVLSLLLNGASNKEIGIRLGIAEITVKNHVSSLLRALNVSNRTQAVSVARRLGMDRISSVIDSCEER